MVQDIKILVKDGDKVKANDKLFTAARKTVKAENAGIVEIKEKYIKWFSEIGSKMFCLLEEKQQIQER